MLLNQLIDSTLTKTKDDHKTIKSMAKAKVGSHLSYARWNLPISTPNELLDRDYRVIFRGDDEQVHLEAMLLSHLI
jgi:hypothetical protein